MKIIKKILICFFILLSLVINTFGFSNNDIEILVPNNIKSIPGMVTTFSVTIKNNTEI